MARSEHLPIYKAAYDLCLYFEQTVRGFSRYHKYALAQDLRDGARHDKDRSAERAGYVAALGRLLHDEDQLMHGVVNVAVAGSLGQRFARWTVYTACALAAA